MTSLPAKVIAIEGRGEQYQVIVQIYTKYRGSFNTLAFGEIKLYSGSLKDRRLRNVYVIGPDKTGRGRQTAISKRVEADPNINRARPVRCKTLGNAGISMLNGISLL